MRYQTRGFTLIELMLALAIGAILTTIGYPVYVSHQSHAQRNRAEVALMQLSAKLEIYFSDNNSYQGATIKKLHATQLMHGLRYKFAIADASDSHYKIQAIPIGAQKKHDAQCATLSLTDTNLRSISGYGKSDQCWQ